MQMESRSTIRWSEPKFGREERFMKMRMIGLLAVASLILAFTFIAVAPAAPNKANAPATNAANALPATPAPADRHPEIREAHRVEALRATDEAIRQLDLCLKFDKD
jgi:hypothetical protein